MLLTLNSSPAFESITQQKVLLKVRDLSAAFDTIEQSFLSNTWQQYFGVTSAALEWFDSFYLIVKSSIHRERF